MDARTRQSPRRKPPTPAAGAARIPRSKKGGQQESGDCGDLPTRKALVARLESQRLELLRAMTCVHLARRTIEGHIGEPRRGDVRPLTPGQHETYRQSVLEMLGVAGDALATAYPMLERIARALEASEMLKEHMAVSSQPTPPPAKRSAAP